MRAVVVDASVALSWCLDDEQSEYANAVLASSNTMRITVPQHWTLEIANVIALAANAGRTSETALADALVLLSNLTIDVDTETQKLALGSIGEIARKHRITAYDAAYLELAIRRKAALASLDKRLVAAATTEGVALFQP